MVPSEQISGRQPLHVAISEQLREQIESGRYEPGERLPSEFDLGERFSVSRTTVRRAISNLIQQGLVTTQQGKGIFVAERRKISFSMSNPLLHFDDALRQQGYTVRVQSLRLQLLPAPREVNQKLQLPHGDSSVYWREQVIYANESPIALDSCFFPEAIGSPILDKLQQGLTYSTLTHNGFPLTAAAVKLESVPATYELSEYLAIPLGMPLLVFDYLAYWGDRTPAVCGRTLSRSDWTCYTSQVEVGKPGKPDLSALNC